MFIKKAAAFAAVIVLSLSAPFAAFADTSSSVSISQLDDTMADAVQSIIDNEISEDIQEEETKILEAIKAEIASAGDDLDDQNKGTKIIKKIAKENDLQDSQWISAFQKGCEQYGVPDGILDGVQNWVDAQEQKTAVTKLHILQWDEDTFGVNRSAMKLMIDRILTNTALSNVMGLCMAFASAMCIAFGLGDIIQQATEKSASTESLWRGFLKMCVGLFVIYNSLYIAAFIIYVGSMILTTALDATSAAGFNNADAYKAHMAMWASVTTVEKAGGFSLLAKTAASGNGNWFTSAFSTAVSAVGDVLGGLVGGARSLVGGFLGMQIDFWGATLGNGIIQFVMSLTVYAVAINTGVRFVFTPLAVADLFSERFRSTGIRWIKALIASALQGIIIYVVYVVGTELSDVLEGGAILPGFSPVTTIVVNLTMIGLFAKSGGIAKEIVGSH